MLSLGTAEAVEGEGGSCTPDDAPTTVVERQDAVLEIREKFDESKDKNDTTIDAPFGDVDAVEAAGADVPADASFLELDQHDVSDISASSSDIDDADEDYSVPVDFNDDKVVNKFDALHRPSSSRTIMPHITNHNTTTDINIRIQRENVNRLLMMSGDRIAGETTSLSTSSSQHSSTYNREYFRNSGDWLRFMQRRHAVHMAERYPETRATCLTNDFNSGGYVHGVSPGFGNTTGYHIDPDQYYRGFDNSRIRMGFSHEHNYPQQLPHGSSPTSMVHPCDYQETFSLSLPIDDEELQCEGALNNRGESMYRNNNLSDVDCGDENVGHDNDIYCSSAKGATKTCSRDEAQDVSQSSRRHQHDASHHSRQSKTTVEGGQQQHKSTLRVGGIILRNSDPLESSSSIHRPHSNPPISRLEREQQHHGMQEEQNGVHEASCDSKYVTYACCIDQSQDDRSVEIPLFSLARPHMRSFHCAWVSFFLAFLAWFAIAPLLTEVQKSLELTKEQIWTSSICSVAGAVITRCVTGVLCDIYGARWMTAVVLFICGVPTVCTGFVNTAVGLDVLRLFTGIAGSAFVTCQYWTCSTFTKEVAGTANAIAAGWGNLGGGIAQIFVGSMLFPFFKWIYAETSDPAELSWRTCCAIPGLFCIAFTFVIIRHSDDSPKGNYYKRKNLGLMQRPSAIRNFNTAMRDYNTWLLLIQYGCCLGVELTTTNALSLYFKEEFEMSTEASAAVASIFGWMNLFARALGGLLSDISNSYRGMRGRLISQLLCFMLEGNFFVLMNVSLVPSISTSIANPHIQPTRVICDIILQGTDPWRGNLSHDNLQHIRSSFGRINIWHCPIFEPRCYWRGSRHCWCRRKRGFGRFLTIVPEDAIQRSILLDGSNNISVFFFVGGRIDPRL